MRKNCSINGRSLLLYQFTTRVIKLTLSWDITATNFVQNFSSILLSRLSPYIFVDEIIGVHQCRFRRKRLSIDQIFCIRQILEKMWEYNERVHQLFVDFNHDCDLVRKEIFYNIFVEFGGLMKLVRLIKMCLNETCSKVRIGKNKEMLYRHCFRTLL
jgi:hypothetical protein